jgi:hypothetical protein
MRPLSCELWDWKLSRISSWTWKPYPRVVLCKFRLIWVLFYIWKTCCLWRILTCNRVTNILWCRGSLVVSALWICVCASKSLMEVQPKIPDNFFIGITLAPGHCPRVRLHGPRKVLFTQFQTLGRSVCWASRIFIQGYNSEALAVLTCIGVYYDILFERFRDV